MFLARLVPWRSKNGLRAKTDNDESRMGTVFGNTFLMTILKHLENFSNENEEFLITKSFSDNEFKQTIK